MSCTRTARWSGAEKTVVCLYLQDAITEVEWGLKDGEFKGYCFLYFKTQELMQKVWMGGHAWAGVPGARTAHCLQLSECGQRVFGCMDVSGGMWLHL